MMSGAFLFIAAVFAGGKVDARTAMDFHRGFCRGGSVFYSSFFVAL